MNLQALLYIVLTGSLLGMNLIAARFMLDQFTPLVFVGLRLAMASAAFLSVYLLDRRRRWPVDLRLWGHAVVIGAIGSALPLITIVSALQYQSSGLTAVLASLSPTLTVLLAHFFFADEALTRLKSLGIVLALGGALLLAIRGESGLPDVSQASLEGYVLTFVALICFSAVTIYLRKFMRNYDLFSVTSAQVFIATLIVLPVALIVVDTDWQQVNRSGYLIIGYSGLAGTFGAFMLFFYCIRQFGAARAAMADYVAPIVASLGGVLLLSEEITLGMVTGIVIIAVGITLLNYGRQVVRPEPI